MSIFLLKKGDWFGVYGQGAWWCAAQGGSCLQTYYCSDDGKCTVGALANTQALENFKRRHGELLQRIKQCRLNSRGRIMGSPDILIWRHRGPRRCIMIEAKTPNDTIRDDQNTCLSALGNCTPSDIPVVGVSLTLVDRSASVEPAFGRGRCYRALIPSALLPAISWKLLEEKSKNALVTQKASKMKQDKNKSGGLVHVDGLRETGFALCGKSFSQWCARHEVVVLLEAMRDLRRFRTGPNFVQI